ncbi:hypothetical protein PMZ80_000743 [Knufia obscura]|uniref:Uncharacterized protein n=2 Tax=Knufia TaxID=430999 RepID=A0AAN8I3Y0_9EURO|nr:hypothetical protein PMZ80_000743 [Knufia obscura]KAK5949115.1 hypothetical protein OHC33_009856 [Knufia fluminis]
MRLPILITATIASSAAALPSAPHKVGLTSTTLLTHATRSAPHVLVPTSLPTNTPQPTTLSTTGNGARSAPHVLVPTSTPVPPSSPTKTLPPTTLTTKTLVTRSERQLVVPSVISLPTGPGIQLEPGLQNEAENNNWDFPRLGWDTPQPGTISPITMATATPEDASNSVSERGVCWNHICGHPDGPTKQPWETKPPQGP